MSFTDYARRLLALAETVHRWLGALAALDRTRREHLARYAIQIADTLARAAHAAERRAANPADAAALSDLARELGRVTGYVETVMDVLKAHLDGRKLTGVKRRLDQLAPEAAAALPDCAVPSADASRLLAAEGYFRALADGLVA